MEYEINDIPFKMEQIPEQLFNSPFLSDITFLIEDKPIYAHSLELMKRSSVFQKQLEPTLCEKKIIPITDYGYDVFYQLIRFIYTDEYTISEEKHFDLLKLAKVYNVIRLVNELINISSDFVGKLNFCVVEKHEIGLNFNQINVNYYLMSCLKSNDFLSIYPATVEKILKFDQITSEVNERDILDALIRWMNHYCIKNNIQFAECCQKFNCLIQLIRFPTMSKDELCDLRTNYPDLLPSSEFQNIAIQKIYGTDNASSLWNCSPRSAFIWPYVVKQFPINTQCETKFTVSSDLILGGIVCCKNFYSVDVLNVIISCNHSDLVGKIQINIQDINAGILSLSTSLRMRPNITYTIDYITKATSSESLVYCRKPHTELVIKAPPNSVNILKAHETLLEMMFLKPNDA